MRIRRFAVPGALAAALALAAASAPPVPVRAGEEVDKKIEEFKEYLKTNPESQGIRNQIADLALLKDPKVADALMPLLKNPKYDDDVKIAVCQAVGRQGKKEIAGILLSMADGKPWEEKPKIRAAAIEAAGEADAKTHYKELIKLAKKYIPTSGDLACAALRAASQHVSRESVDDMVTQLVVVTPSSMPANQASRRPHYDMERPVLIDILKKMTGEDYGDATAWKRWWDDNKKTWNPPAPGEADKPKDLNASDTFADHVRGFEIKKPNKRWSFRKGGGDTHILTIEAMDEGQRAAWCEVYAQESKNMRSKSPEALAKEVQDVVEPKFRDVKEGSTWTGSGSYGGEKAAEHVVFGQHKDFDAIRMHNVFVYYKGYAFRFETVYKSGKAASLQSDAEEILKSIRFTD